MSRFKVVETDDKPEEVLKELKNFVNKQLNVTEKKKSFFKKRFTFFKK